MPPAKVLYNLVQFVSQKVDVSETVQANLFLLHHSWKKKTIDLW